MRKRLSAGDCAMRGGGLRYAVTHCAAGGVTRRAGIGWEKGKGLSFGIGLLSFCGRGVFYLNLVWAACAAGNCATRRNRMGEEKGLGLLDGIFVALRARGLVL